MRTERDTFFLPSSFCSFSFFSQDGTEGFFFLIIYLAVMILFWSRFFYSLTRYANGIGSRNRDKQLVLVCSCTLFVRVHPLDAYSRESAAAGRLHHPRRSRCLSYRATTVRTKSGTESRNRIGASNSKEKKKKKTKREEKKNVYEIRMRSVVRQRL